MTTKRTNWRTALCSILAVALSALAIEIAAGHVPIPTDAAWAVPIVVPALVALTSKLREEAGEPPEPTYADLPYKVPPRTWIDSRAPWPAPDGSSPLAPSAPIELAPSRQPPGPEPPGVEVES